MPFYYAGWSREIFVIFQSEKIDRIRRVIAQRHISQIQTKNQNVGSKISSKPSRMSVF